MKNTEKNAPAITIILPCYDSPEQIEHCLTHVLNQDYIGVIKVIAIDNSSSFTLEPLIEKYPAVQFLHEKKPGSYNARNTGLKETKTPLVAFIDSDCSAHPSWITNGVERLMADPSTGVVGGQINIVPINSEKITIGEHHEIATAMKQDFYAKYLRFAATANAFTRLSTIKQIGSFDGKLMSGGDLDWGQRVHAAGLKVVYEPSAIVDHPARTHNQILRKTWRITSGKRDQSPSWLGCLIFCMRRAVPPVWHIKNIWKSQNITALKKLALTFYSIYLNLISALYRIKIQLNQTASPRE
jgi:GT2 family glycosyltransferase